MSLNFLPVELENIIDNYSYQVQHRINFAKYADELKQRTSIRQEDVHYAYELNHSRNVWELLCHHSFDDAQRLYLLEERIKIDEPMINISFNYSLVEEFEYF